jgi:hypothetical protein
VTEQDRKPLAALLTGLAEIFGAELSKTVHALYFEALQDIPLEDIKRAARAALATAKYMPRPAELRELAGHGLESKEQAIERAWQSWKTAVRKHGSYGSVLFEDGAIARTLVAIWGSWPGACLTEHSEEMWASKRKEFGRVYVLHSHEPMYLAGQAELSNRVNRGTFTRGNEPAEQIALVGRDAAIEVKALPVGSNPLALLGSEMPAVTSGEQEPTPEEAASVLARLKAHVAEHLPAAESPAAPELSEADYQARLAHRRMVAIGMDRRARPALGERSRGATMNREADWTCEQDPLGANPDRAVPTPVQQLHRRHDRNHPRGARTPAD